MDKSNNNLLPNYTYFMEDYFSMILSQLCSLKVDQSDFFLHKVFKFNSYRFRFLDKPLNILLIGLGGGALAMYCKTWLKGVK